MLALAKYTGKAAKKTTGFLDKVGKYALPIVIVVVLFFIIKNQFKSFYNNVVDSVGSVGSSLSRREVQVISEFFESRIIGWTKGKHEDEMVDKLLTLSKSDFNKVSNYFGVRWYSRALGDFGIWGISASLNLAQILMHEIPKDKRQSLVDRAPYYDFLL